LSPDSKQIAAGSTDGIVRVWDVAMRRAIFTYRGHTSSVNTVAWQQGPLLFSANETRIASGGADGTVQVWSFGKAKNAKDQQAMTLQGNVLVYRGHSDAVTSVTWSPDRERIASGSVDGTVQLWQAR
jgi:eukaryotic-like serine/threonine-protein kinase